MWRDLEEDAIRIGLSLDYFWKLTPKQFTKHIRVFNQQEKQRVQEIDTLNHILANYIGFAINEPKKYPKKPYLFEQPKKELRKMSADEMEMQAYKNSILLGGVINGDTR